MKHTTLGVVVIAAVEGINSLPVDVIIKLIVQGVIGACAIINVWINHRKSKKK